jgi:indolepyruvate ferredoxin oxidoreductase alpha subunit
VKWKGFIYLSSIPGGFAAVQEFCSICEEHGFVIGKGRIMLELLTGNEAVARGAYEAGVHFAAAYPGTPSTEILEALAKYDEVDAQWSPNEKVAMEVAIGAAIGGARSMVSMKHVGLNVAADPLFTASYMGVNGGLVIVTADDPGMHSSQDEQDNRYYARFAKLPMLEPSNSQECKDYVVLAFALSEEFDTPVLLRLTTRTAHGRSPVNLGQRQEIKVKEYKRQIEKYIVLPAHARKLHPKVHQRMVRLEDYACSTPVNEIQLRGRELGIVTCGAAYQYVREACPEASVLKLGMTYPVPAELIRRFAGEVDELVVVEELEPLLEDHIRGMSLEVKGKDLFTRFGELSTEIIREGLGLENAVSPGGSESCGEPEQPIPGRPPVLCPGCPHRGVFYNLNRLGAVVTGDIGCYTLGALPPLSAMDTCLCMGASIGKALGMEKAQGKEFARKTVAVIGDSTFLHSGITGLMDVVYNHGTITTVILDNGITAMTGHQHNPATGFTAKRGPAYKVDLEQIARAVGVERVRVVDAYDIDAVYSVLKEEMAVEEPSVVIARRPCALTVKSRSKGYSVNSRCIGCRKCIKLGCPALAIKDGVAEINSQLCTGCGMCAQVCPRQAITLSEESKGDSRG